MFCVKFVNCRPSKLAMESICVKGSANTDVFNHPSYNDCVILANSGFVECSSYDRKYIMRIQVQEPLKYEVQEVNLYQQNAFMKKIQRWIGL